MDKRALGKLTDSNHLEAFRNETPADYDKKIISLYTQTSLYSNDFLDMINKSKPFLIEGNTDAWKWDIQVPYKFPKIVDIPTSTQDLSSPGIDGQEFQLVIDTNEFSKNTKFAIGDRRYGPQVYVIEDPVPYGRAYLYTVTLVSDNPLTDSISSTFLAAGLELFEVDNIIGEFDQDLGGLGRLGEKITMFESLSGGYGYQHTITKWADEKMMVDENGKPKDILVYVPQRRNQMPLTRNDIRWEPFVEFLMRKKMMETKVNKMIWSKPGTVKTGGRVQEVKKSAAGLYYRMRNNGNHVQYNRGEFSANLLRSVFGDLYYRRVDVSKRHVKMYTNEAGFDVFQQAAKDDAFNSGLTFFTNIDGAVNGKVGSDSPQNMLTYGFAFNSIYTRESGLLELFHLKELDLPQTNLEFGQNKKSTPIFFVFDVSPTSDGGLMNNIREVRLKGAPSMTWGYVDGRQHHLGHFASKGMSSANMFPGYTIWMEDRCDIFVEDLSRTVIIEEVPQY
jgi:hypothetical protein